MTKHALPLMILTLLAGLCLNLGVCPGVAGASPAGGPLIVAQGGSLDDGDEDMDLQEDLEAGTVGDIVDSDSAGDQWEPAVMGDGGDGLDPGPDGDEDPLD